MAQEDIPALIQALQDVGRSVGTCPLCGFFAEAGQCALCSDPSRDRGTICVVEQITDVICIEESGGYHGLTKSGLVVRQLHEPLGYVFRAKGHVLAQVCNTAEIERDGKRPADRNAHIGFGEFFGQLPSHLDDHSDTTVGVRIKRRVFQRIVQCLE